MAKKKFHSRKPWLKKLIYYLWIVWCFRCVGLLWGQTRVRHSSQNNMRSWVENQGSCKHKQELNLEKVPSTADGSGNGNEEPARSHGQRVPTQFLFGKNQFCTTEGKLQAENLSRSQWYQTQQHLVRPESMSHLNTPLCWQVMSSLAYRSERAVLQVFVSSWDVCGGVVSVMKLQIGVVREVTL